MRGRNGLYHGAVERLHPCSCVGRRKGCGDPANEECHGQEIFYQGLPTCHGETTLQKACQDAWRKIWGDIAMTVTTPDRRGGVGSIT